MTIFKIVLAFVLTNLAVRAEIPPIGAVGMTNGLVWDAKHKNLTLGGMTNWVYLAYSFTNSSPEDITIYSAETTCECTVVDAAEKFPRTVAPGESGSLNVRVNTKGVYGKMEKGIAVKTSQGPQSLAFHLQIPLSPAPFNRSVREQDLLAAKADRQAVFQGHCAACHNWPAINQNGETLYHKACGICHNSENRAEIVPNLAALKQPTDEEYWRKMIAYGKPGTLMPAFAASEGGILDKYQIHSLVEFLQKKYPSKSAPTPVASSPAKASN